MFTLQKENSDQSRKRRYRFPILGIAALLFFTFWQPAFAQNGPDDFQQYINQDDYQYYRNGLFLGMFNSEKEAARFLEEQARNPANLEPYDVVFAFGKSGNSYFVVAWEVTRVVGDNLSWSPLTNYEKVRGLKFKYLVAHSNGNDVAANALKAGVIKAEHFISLAAPAGFAEEAKNLPVRNVDIYYTRGDPVVEKLGKKIIVGLLQKLGDLNIGLIGATDSGEPIIGLELEIPLRGGENTPEIRETPAFDDPDFFTRHPHHYETVANNVALKRMYDLEKELEGALDSGASEREITGLANQLEAYHAYFPESAKMFDFGFLTTSYWTYREPGQRAAENMADAQLMTEMVRGKKKVIVAGEGPEADLMYEEMVRRLGKQNVRRIPKYSAPIVLKIKARRFGADVILGVEDRKKENPARAADNTVERAVIPKDGRPIIGVAVYMGSNPIQDAFRSDWMIHRIGATSWYEAHRRGEPESVLILDGNNKTPAEIVAEVEHQVQTLKLPPGSTVVLGGDPQDSRFLGVKAALEAEGHEVLVVDCRGLNKTDSLVKIAEAAGENGARIGVYYPSANGEEPQSLYGADGGGDGPEPEQMDEDPYRKGPDVSVQRLEDYRDNRRKKHVGRDDAGNKLPPPPPPTPDAVSSVPLPPPVRPPSVTNSPLANLPIAPLWGGPYPYNYNYPPALPYAGVRNPVGQLPSGDIGGVMLRGAASVSDETGNDAQLSGGSFSLIFENGSAEIDIKTLRQFCTALWAVYFEEEGPGISIDPIAPGVDKHLVRYIGHVVNSDLGRVMRVTDYSMKKWAVGSEKPNIPGFKSVDDLTATHGINYLGASRRFWFVPEDMRFTVMGDALIFDSGRMTVKTEYVSLDKQTRAEPADEEFARFFTEHYQEIARKYPVFQELFEYAKLVSLAKYLKEKRVPLLWFLLANKDMALTEDSPGTVDAIAKQSEHFEYIWIEGGVDLAVKPGAQQYVIDREAAQALSQALSRYRTDDFQGVSTLSSENITFRASAQDLTLTDVQTLTLSNSTVSGETYQTDLALWHGGKPGLELVRYYDPDLPGNAAFGPGWHLLIPYRVAPASGERIEFLNADIPEKMVVRNLLTGREEVLTFSEERYSIAGYVPDSLAQTNTVGLFLLSDGSFRLADKLGNEFQFDTAGELTEMIFTENYAMQLEYGYETCGWEAFPDAGLPYRLEPAGEETAAFLNVEVPRTLRLINAAEDCAELFLFNPDNNYGIGGYIPADKNSRYEILALMSDGSFVLSDRAGNEISFDLYGQFSDIKSKVIKGLSVGNQSVTFAYEFAGAQPRVVSATVSAGAAPLAVLHYRYDDSGKLARVITPQGRKVEIRYEEDRLAVARR